MTRNKAAAFRDGLELKAKRFFHPSDQFTVNVATLLFCATTAPDEFFTVPCTVYVPVAEGVKVRLL